jgi:hypothetical protein
VTFVIKLNTQFRKCQIIILQCADIQQAATKENYITILAKLLGQQVKEYDLTLQKERAQKCTN